MAVGRVCETPRAGPVSFVDARDGGRLTTDGGTMPPPPEGVNDAGPPAGGLQGWTEIPHLCN
jgi:hypothetical protein